MAAFSFHVERERIPRHIHAEEKKNKNKSRSLEKKIKNTTTLSTKIHARFVRNSHAGRAGGFFWGGGDGWLVRTPGACLRRQFAKLSVSQLRGKKGKLCSRVSSCVKP